MKIKISKSYSKYIRREKSLIRREILDIKDQETAIKKLYQKLGLLKLKIN